MAIKRSNWTLWTTSYTPTVNTAGWANGPTGTYNPILDGKKWNIVSPLSTADVLNARYQAAYNQWNTNLANAYKTLNQENTTYNNVANQIADYYNVLAQNVAKREAWLAGAKYDLANKLFNDMADQKDYVWWLYWPNGSLTKAINTYYDDMGDYLASEAGREMAYADAMWVQSWASLWMMRAQRNQAYNEAFQKSIQVMQAELEAKQAIAQNLITFMTNLRKEYWDTANDYIIAQYERANDLLNTIEENIAKTSASIQAARFSWGSGWWGTNTTTTKTWDEMSSKEKIEYLKEQWIKADNTNVIGWTPDWSMTVTFSDGTKKTINSWDLVSLWWKNWIITFLWTWAVSNPWTWNANNGTWITMNSTWWNSTWWNNK